MTAFFLATEEMMEKQLSQMKGLCDKTSDVSFAFGTVYCEGTYDIHKAINEADEKMYKDKAEFYRTHPERDRRKNR